MLNSEAALRIRAAVGSARDKLRGAEMTILFSRLIALLLLAGLAAAAACSGDDQQQEQQSQGAAVAEGRSAEPVSEPEQQEAQQEDQAAQGDAQDDAEQQASQEAEDADDAQQQEAQDAADEQAEKQEEESAEPETDVAKWELGSDRPATLMAPSDYDGEEELGLAVLLHGYMSNAEAVNWYFGGAHLFINDFRFALLLPQGQAGADGETFWDATPACCEFTETDSDDVAYLSEVIDEARGYVNVSGVYIIGNSNGGFMAYRMACENAVPDLRGIVSLAGSSFEDPAICADAPPVALAQIHGTDDEDILYEGNPDLLGLTDDDESLDGHPGALELVRRWAGRAGCDLDAPQAYPRYDLVSDIDGEETVITRYRDGCVDGLTFDLWTVEQGPHSPAFASLTPALMAWVADIEQFRIAGALFAEPPVLEERGVSFAERPAALLLPDGYERGETLPLMVLLHGYSGESQGQDFYFRMRWRINDDRFALLLPDGQADDVGNQFWDATPACCEFGTIDSNDVDYISGLIDQARQEADIDGVYFVGHSNGGFMSYTMACSGRVADLRAVVSLAGSTFEDPARCENPGTVSILQIHGDADAVILYGGHESLLDQFAALGVSKPGVSDADDGYPGAVELVNRWAGIAGCDLDAAETLERFDIDNAARGAETVPTRYREGCAGGSTVELWTLEGGSHTPLFRDQISARILDWLRDSAPAAGK